jgi:hypothetical protein
MNINRIVIFIFTVSLISSIVTSAFAQVQQPYPQGYFVYPVDKAKVGIVANFGELRPNHWHMGLDCRTDKKENYPILAAAEGYISKVKIEPYGFGNAIYIAHPNGLTTLYAHLNDFYPELQAYVKEQQYNLKSWKVFIDVPANKFPVTKGQFIAFSGNTGGSMGPHLHFEIRDTKTDKVLNPLRFGFNLPDNVKPVVKKIAIYDRNKSVYEQTPQFVSLIKKGTDYVVKDTILLKTDCASIGIAAYDQISNTPNQNGIFGAALFDGNQMLSSFRLDSIGYDETRFLNAHIDFKLKATGGGYIQHVSALPGNTIAAYQSGNLQKGQIDLSDGLPHNMSIIVSDANGNATNVFFVMKKSPKATSLKDSVVVGYRYALAGQPYTYKTEDIMVNINQAALYDRIMFNVTSSVVKAAAISNLYQVQNSNVPLHNNIEISIKPTMPIADALQTKVVAVLNSKEGYAATKKGNYYSINTRDFGNYYLAVDTIAPVITPINFTNNSIIKANSIRFTVKDNYTNIKKCEAFLDGEWILVGYKGSSHYYKVDERLTPGVHQLKIEATDEVGNVNTKVYTISK